MITEPMDERLQVVKNAIAALISAHRAEFDHLVAEAKREAKEKNL